MLDPILPTDEDDFVFANEEPFLLESGRSLQPVKLHYAIYGKLNEKRDNAILVCHALSGSARVGDWWPQLFGKEGVFNLEEDCVIGINVLGSCYGSTGPLSIDPVTGKPFGANFPLVTTRDWVRTQALLLDHLRVATLRSVIGASVGGMQAIEWAIEYPTRVSSCIAIGAAALNTMGLALNHLQRKAIYNDPYWRNGEYTAENPPAAGLGLARAIAMCSYKSATLFAERYARKPNRNGEDPRATMNDRYDIGGYLDYQGEIFTERFDANAYLMITKAMDNFDPASGYLSEFAAFSRIRAWILLVGISSDWLFPAEDIKALGERMRSAGAKVEYTELTSTHGHDGFLADPKALALIVRQSIEAIRKNIASSIA